LNGGEGRGAWLGGDHAGPVRLGERHPWGPYKPSGAHRSSTRWCPRPSPVTEDLRSAARGLLSL